MLNPLADISENISRMLGDFVGEDKAQSIVGMLEGMREKGFASNKVDLVAHGIAGNVARAAAMVKPDKFYADGGETHNNYGKGFFNKLISLAVPHNGSPVMDMFGTLNKQLTGLGLPGGIFKDLLGLPGIGGLSKLVQNFPDSIKPYPFLIPQDSTIKVAAELVKKAAMGAERLVLNQTQVKNHLIVSNVDLDPAAPKPFKGGGFLGIMGPVMNAIMRDASPQMRAILTSSMSSFNSQLFKSLNLANLFGSLKGIADFTKNSDLFSHLGSQAAGQPLTLPNITKVTSDSADDVTHEGVLNFSTVGRLIGNLLNTSISSPLFSDVIPANNTPEAPEIQVSDKTIAVSYDTNKVVTDDRQIITGQNLRKSADPSVVLNFRVKDTVGLQYVFINFQDSLYTTTSKERNQQVTLKIRKAMAYSGVQKLEAVGVYERADSIIYHADTMRAYVVPPPVEDFRVKAEEVELYDDNVFHPTYEVKVSGAWQDLPSSDTAIKKVIEKPNVLKYDSANVAFSAIDNGYSRAYFTYKTFRDTVAFECLGNSLSSINRSVVSGNFKDAATWSKGRAPLPGDSIIISAGHNVILDTTAQIRSLRIDNLATLTLSDATKQLQLGDAEDGDFVLDNYGSLNIWAGNLIVRGRVKLNAASTFNMTGGTLVVDGNTGYTITSLANGNYLFEAAPSMSSFAFTGGTLQIVDPPLGVASQAINCPYEFGVNSTLILGNGVSTTASNNPNGFGGSMFPPVLGRLVLDAGTAASNRQFTVTKPLNVRGSFEVKAGSHIVLEAELRVTQ